MASTTPTSAPPHQRPTSRNALPSRPTTPLRAPSRTSLRASTTTPTGSLHGASSTAPHTFPLESLEPAFGELADGMADLEANMMHLQLLHESLNRFNECFGSFLYGLNMSAFCVDFPEAPGAESFKRAREAERLQGHEAAGAERERERDREYRGRDVDATFLTTDTSFVENPPTPRKPPGKSTPAPPSVSSSRTASVSHRGSSQIGRGRGVPVVRGTRAGSLAAAARETGVNRGRGRGVIR